MKFADVDELECFLSDNSDIELLELLMPDINGILRCKRIQKAEFGSLFRGDFQVPRSVSFLGIMGEMYDGVSQLEFGGDPDQIIRPVAGTLARVPWYDSPVAQVLTAYTTPEGKIDWVDPRSPLINVIEILSRDGLSPVTATELEFYLLDPTGDERPSPLVGKIPGTQARQAGIQYCMVDDLIDCDALLNDIREACELHGVPLTAIHSEFSPGQWEINTHHVDDPVLAADHAMLLRRIVKGVARKYDTGATFMAKPFADIAGSGMHIHASLYDRAGNNVFACDPDTVTEATLEASDTIRHAIAGLGDTLDEAMVIFAPNPNSYRRFKAGAFAPSGPTWGYDHREVALRIPRSSESNRRIEHRLSGADANPYLVLAAVLAGMHWGISNALEPGMPVPREADLSEAPTMLPTRLDTAIQLFKHGDKLTPYLGATFTREFAAMRQGESDDYHGRVPDLDYAFYLRAI